MMYNLDEIRKLIDRIYQNYSELDKLIVSKWDVLLRTLRREWVGYDEQDYEKKFAKKLTDLSRVTSDVANVSMNAIYEVARALYEQEINNTLNGERANVPAFKLDYKRVSPIVEGKLPAGGLSFGLNTSKGIKNGKNGATILHNAVQDFVSSVEQKAYFLAETIDTNKAFLGGYSTSIRNYLVRCTEATAIMATCVADLDQALSILVGAKVSSVENAVNEVFHEATNNVNTAVDEVASSRWE